MPYFVIAKLRKELWQSVPLCVQERIPTTSLRTGLGMTGSGSFCNRPCRFSVYRLFSVREIRSFWQSVLSSTK